MSNERDEYIKRLMAKAEQQRERETRPRSAARGSSGAAPASAPAVGKNGRQAVANPADTKSGVKGVSKSTLSKGAPRSAQKSGAKSPKNPQQSAPTNIARQNQVKQKPKTDSEAHIWASLFLIFVALFLAMSVVSYMIYFQADEYLAYFQYLFNSSLTGAENWGGKLGAILGNLVVGRSFGVMGLGVPVIVMIWAIKVLDIPTLALRKATRSTVIVMLVGSVALGQFAGIDTTVFGSGYGGDLGIYAAEWLQGVLGYEGTSLLVALAGVGILYFVNSGWIRSFVRWIGHRMEHSRLMRAARMMAERERDEQLRAQLAASAAARMAAAATTAAAVAAVAKVEPIVE